MEKSPMKNILIVEDSEVNRAEVVAALQKNSDYQITEVGSGDEGFALLAKDNVSFDLVILDYHMPGMNGIQLLRKLAESGRKVQCPVVMITTELEERGTELKDLNIMSWVLKPFNRQRLESLVTKLFEYLEMQDNPEKT